jgi:hypothetical protein
MFHITLIAFLIVWWCIISMISRRLIEYFTAPEDVSGSTLNLRRTIEWPSHYSMTFDAAHALGTAVANSIVEIGRYAPGSNDAEYVLRDASMAAMQEPPLMGKHLLEFMRGAESIVVGEN